MAVVRRRRKMTRTQISFVPEELDAAKDVASRRGMSLAEFVRVAVAKETGQDEAEHRAYVESMMSWIGSIKDADPKGSVTIDEVVYGGDIHR